MPLWPFSFYFFSIFLPAHLPVPCQCRHRRSLLVVHLRPCLARILLLLPVRLLCIPRSLLLQHLVLVHKVFQYVLRHLVQRVVLVHEELLHLRLQLVLQETFRFRNVALLDLEVLRTLVEVVLQLLVVLLLNDTCF